MQKSFPRCSTHKIPKIVIRILDPNWNFRATATVFDVSSPISMLQHEVILSHCVLGSSTCSVLLGVTNFGQNEVWPLCFYHLWPTPSLASTNFVFEVGWVWEVFRVGAPKGKEEGPEEAPKGGGEGGRRVGSPKFRALFSLSRPKICAFSLTLGGLLVEFWWCF